MCSDVYCVRLKRVGVKYFADDLVSSGYCKCKSGSCYDSLRFILCCHICLISLKRGVLGHRENSRAQHAFDVHLVIVGFLASFWF